MRVHPLFSHTDEHHQTTTVDHLNPPSKTLIDGPKLTPKSKNKNKLYPDNELSSSSSSNSTIQRGFRIKNKRKNPRFCVRRSVSDVESIAFPLGMSIAAVLAQILEKKNLSYEKVPTDHLAMICTSAVRESLTNVFGDKFDAFARNFEKSFGSTLSTLRLINNSSIESKGNQIRHTNVSQYNYDASQPIFSNGGDSSPIRCDITNGHLELINFTSRRDEEVEDIYSNESINQELSLQGHVSSQIVVPTMVNNLASRSVLGTLEKSIIEQTRANDLKSMEIGLTMKKLKLKEAQLELNSDLNLLERCKLSLGMTKTSFKAEKFKTQQEETRHGELLRICTDFLFADLIIMSSCLFYGVYAFSYDNLRRLTKSCSAVEVSKSWWIPKPMASFNSGLQTLNCQVQVLSRILFGALMILSILYMLYQRSGKSTQAMPITFLILLLGFGCGFAGKLCVDTLGGDGYLWLIYWEVQCLLHFFLNVFTPFFYFVLNGPIQVTRDKKTRPIFPYWMRRWCLYFVLILIPLCCGLLPFASAKTWWEEHFSKLIRNHFLAAYDDESDFDDENGSGFHG